MPGADSRHDDAHLFALSSRQRADACADAPFASRSILRDEGSAVGFLGEYQKQIPRTASRAPRNRGTGKTTRDSARDDNEMGDSVAPNDNASPRSFAGPARPAGGRSGATPLQSQIPFALSRMAQQRQARLPGAACRAPTKSFAHHNSKYFARSVSRFICNRRQHAVYSRPLSH